MVESEKSPSPERVLVVDDEPDIRKVIARTLTRLGYEVSSAENGEAAIKLVSDLQPQVIVSDIKMPQMDGHTLLRRLAALDVDAAVVVMSAHGDMDDVIDVLRAGATDYLKKPWVTSELVKAVARATEIHDLRVATRRASRGAAATGVAAAPPTDPPPTDPPPKAEEALKAEEAPQDPIFAAITEQLRRGEIGLPPFPAVLSELRSVLSRPDSALSEIGLLVERDPRFAAQILRTANTAQFARGGRVNDIKTAVGRLGLRHVQSIVQTVVLRGIHPAKDANLKRLQAEIWRYSIARAVSMRGLAAALGPNAKVEAETAYLAGLLADVGASFLLWVVGERANVASSQVTTPEQLLAGVRDGHEALGGRLLNRWDLDPVVSTISGGHHPGADGWVANPYWNLCVVGSSMADTLVPNGDPTTSMPSSVPLLERCTAELHLPASALAKVSIAARHEFDEVMNSLG